jgi:serine/threonine protein kinase
VEAIRPNSERAPAEGDVLRGRYRLLRLVGQGTVGSVFEALDLSRVDAIEDERLVAVKVLHPAVLKRPRVLADLRREFQHLQALSHPNIVRVHEFDRDGDVVFFTMEYLRGITLRRLLGAENPQGLDRRYALAIVRDVGAAIAHAHSRGIVHGDLNPGNIVVTDRGDLRVLDFGATPALRRLPAPDGLDDPRPVAVEPQTFASCEMLEGGVADPSADLFALACLTYLLIAGHHPFQDINSLKARSLRISPRRPRGLKRRQWLALKAGLQLDRERRPSDVATWVAEMDVSGAAPRLPLLRSLLASHPTRRGGAAWLTIGVAAALFAGGGWWIAGHVDAVQGRGAEWLARLNMLLNHGMDALRSTPMTTPAESASPGSVVSPDAPPSVTAAAPPTPEPAQSNSPMQPRAAAAPAAQRPPAAAIRPAAAAALPANPALTPVAPTSPGARARIELAADNVEVAPDDSAARVIVRRTRSLRGDASFSWWTESGTAKPGQDFVAVKSHLETIPSGKESLTLLVPIVMDPARRQERNFYLVIDEPSDNAALGTRTLTMVTIPAPQPE